MKGCGRSESKACSCQLHSGKPNPDPNPTPTPTQTQNRVYKTYDPRSRVMKAVVDELLEATGVE
jgi:hypothetical protein